MVSPRFVLVTAVSVLVCLTVPGSVSAAPPGRPDVTHACGDPLSAGDVRRIVELSDTTDGHESALPTLERQVGKLWQITDILTAHRDRRGLFALGLAAVERDAVMPMQRRPATFRNPRWAPVISLRLLDRFFAAVHAEFSGGPVPPQWARYFGLTLDCGASGERAALTGYNAHITVDLAYATADARTIPDDAPDFFRLVDAIAAHGDSIVRETNRIYHVDLGPTFRFYFVGEGLDRLVGAGKATGPMLRAADVGYNVLTFGNGLALQDPRSRDTAAADIAALWNTGDAALTAFESLGVLR
ncbi:DUF5995 family protein [Gordonia aichiensis]|uniref:Uncharacterized protein n=1 Tax=Gordonia aichiensis NBRC 108223 TaxID=1220583 RepID=L7KL03_9ACTN|nr:DUF5995 family protein [Gordonia aichiensis]GAC49540.1 hypothetical protein GOACH_15_00320 [Gordonia aichiensis NBRC 108223]